MQIFGVHWPNKSVSSDCLKRLPNKFGIMDVWDEIRDLDDKFLPQVIPIYCVTTATTCQ